MLLAVILGELVGCPLFVVERVLLLVVVIVLDAVVESVPV